jgi:hypothetical protein
MSIKQLMTFSFTEYDSETPDGYNCNVSFSKNYFENDTNEDNEDNEGHDLGWNQKMLDIAGALNSSGYAIDIDVLATAFDFYQEIIHEINFPDESIEKNNDFSYSPALSVTIYDQFNDSLNICVSDFNKSQIASLQETIDNIIYSMEFNNV